MHDPEQLIKQSYQRIKLQSTEFATNFYNNFFISLSGVEVFIRHYQDGRAKAKIDDRSDAGSF